MSSEEPLGLPAFKNIDAVGDYDPVFHGEARDLGELIIQDEPVPGFQAFFARLINEMLGNDFFGVLGTYDHIESITQWAPRSAHMHSGGCAPTKLWDFG